MKYVIAAVLFAVCSVGTAHAGAVDDDREHQQTWTVWGGDVGVRWNRDLATDIGLHIGAAVGKTGVSPRGGFVRFAVQPIGSLKFSMRERHFQGFRDGTLRMHGGYQINFSGGQIDLIDFRLVPRADNPLILDIVSADGEAWFYCDRLMYDMPGADDMLHVRTMDVRISSSLAARLGQPEVAGWAIADMQLQTHVVRWGGLPHLLGSCNDANGANCNFAGTQAPNGGTYQADLFMMTFTPQYSRCQGCTGIGGQGQVVFTPSSKLKNNVNAGSIQTTVYGQGSLGISSALWAADIPWFEKFSGDFPPYQNDQHPYLIWNMYRINGAGQLVQIGRSGIKHAFLTVNSGSDCAYGYGHVLGRSCEDTYSEGNNDTNTALGPRSEVIAASNVWGRCGSIYDPDCDAVYNDPGNGYYDQRLIVRESEIADAGRAESTWLFESWYLAREDINIYNSMGTVATTQTWTGNVWAMNASGYKIGPAIDRWVDPLNPGPNASNSGLDVGEGHAKVAVKVTDVGNGTWRYDYAVMNLDFARAVTTNSHPGDSDYLHVVSNQGFDRFSIPVPTGATLSLHSFTDGDEDAGNDWLLSSSGNAIVFTAPATNTLDWGSLYSFSITVDAAPDTAATTLHVAQAGTPATYALSALVPMIPELSDIIFANGFEAGAPAMGFAR